MTEWLESLVHVQDRDRLRRLLNDALNASEKGAQGTAIKLIGTVLLELLGVEILPREVESTRCPRCGEDPCGGHVDLIEWLVKRMAEKEQNLVELIRQNFFAELDAKTGWGKNEIKDAFERSVGKAALTLLS